MACSAPPDPRWPGTRCRVTCCSSTAFRDRPAARLTIPPPASCCSTRSPKAPYNSNNLNRSQSPSLSLAVDLVNQRQQPLEIAQLLVEVATAEAGTQHGDASTVIEADAVADHRVGADQVGPESDRRRYAP